MRVLVDTSVFIASLIKLHADSFLTVLLNHVVIGDVTLLITDALIEEINETIRRKPKLLNAIGSEQLGEIIELLQVMGEDIPADIEKFPAVTRDPKDDYLIAYAVVGEADYLISVDKDLLVLEQIQGVKIVHTGEFRAVLRDLD